MLTEDIVLRAMNNFIEFFILETAQGEKENLLVGILVIWMQQHFSIGKKKT